MKRWTKQDIETLRKLYQKYNFRICASIMNLDPGIIKAALGRYKITGPRDGKLKKGHEPWNKGKHILVNPKCLQTTFQKGHIPHNAKWDGYISRWNDKSGKTYLFIRVAMGKWQALHRYLWEQKIGPIPKGKIIVFKDGNTFNINLTNLELISRQEHARRNHNAKKKQVNLLKRGIEGRKSENYTV